MNLEEAKKKMQNLKRLRKKFELTLDDFIRRYGINDEKCDSYRLMLDSIQEEEYDLAKIL